MADIFISYKREDRDWAEALSNALGDQGWTVWWDTRLAAGDKFDDVIENELDNAKCVIVLWSAESVKSRWVRVEAGEAFERDILVPVFIEEVKPPLAFRRVHTSSLVDWDKSSSSPSIERLVEDLILVLGQPNEIKKHVASSDIYCFMLGKFSLEAEGSKIKLGNSKKLKSLLAYLFYHHRNDLHKDILTEHFWPHTTTFSARSNLSSYISKIRKLFYSYNDNNQLIIYRNDCYIFNPYFCIKLDVDIFIEHIESGKKLEKQSGLQSAIKEYEKADLIYKGSFLGSFYYSSYDDWVYNARYSLEEKHIFSLERMSAYYQNQENHKKVENICKRILNKDAYREDIHRRLMKNYHLMGKRVLALKQFEECANALKRELDIEPSKKTLVLLEQIKSDNL